MTVKIRALVPDFLINAPKMQAAIKAACHKTGKRLRTSLKRPASTWHDKPTFDIEDIPNGVRVSTAHDKYVWTDLGTRPHIIRARQAGYLHFRYPYTAKTRPGSLSAGRGGYGGNWARKRAVHHPGTRARGFSERVAMLDQRSGHFAKDVQEAIIRAAKP